MMYAAAGPIVVRSAAYGGKIGAKRAYEDTQIRLFDQ
jgi:hypothetical protein